MSKNYEIHHWADADPDRRYWASVDGEFRYHAATAADVRRQAEAAGLSLVDSRPQSCHDCGSSEPLARTPFGWFCEDCRLERAREAAERSES